MDQQDQQEREQKTILVIEDDLYLRRDISEMFAFDGFNVIGAADGLEGLRQAREHLPDLIVCDIMMPELDGYGVLIELRSDPVIAATPFIFLTAKLDNTDRRRGMELGADDYITKPFTYSDLFRAVLSGFRKREIIRQAIRNEKDYHVFLSYNRQDTLIMKRLRDDLVQANLKVWCDDELEPGTPDWDKAVVEAIKYSGCLVVILTPDAEKSKWVGRELGLAETLNIRIFPVLARGDERSSIPFRLINTQWIDARQDYSAAFDRLVSSVKKHVGMQP